MHGVFIYLHIRHGMKFTFEVKFCSIPVEILCSLREVGLGGMVGPSSSVIVLRLASFVVSSLASDSSFIFPDFDIFEASDLLSVLYKGKQQAFNITKYIFVHQYVHSY